MRLVAIHVLSQYFSVYISSEEKITDFEHSPDYEKIFQLTKSDWEVFLKDSAAKREDVCFFTQVIRANENRLKLLSSVIHASLLDFEKANLNYVLYSDKNYPTQLRHLMDAPAGLSFYGDRA